MSSMMGCGWADAAHAGAAKQAAAAEGRRLIVAVLARLNRGATLAVRSS
jgi:hypothetical protein